MSLFDSIQYPVTNEYNNIPVKFFYKANIVYTNTSLELNAILTEIILN